MQVNFLHGSDDKPWVWVMGEYKDDMAYDEIVKTHCSYGTTRILLHTHQVRRRELKKLEEEDLAEIMEAEKLAKKGIMSIISTCMYNIYVTNLLSCLLSIEMEADSRTCEIDGPGATERCQSLLEQL